MTLDLKLIHALKNCRKSLDKITNQIIKNKVQFCFHNALIHTIHQTYSLGTNL